MLVIKVMLVIWAKVVIDVMLVKKVMLVMWVIANRFYG